MKTKFLRSIILTTSIAFSASAAYSSSVLNVRLADGRPLVISVDGIRQQGFSKMQRVDYLTPGFHRIKVLTIQRHPFGLFPVTRVVYEGGIRIAPNSEIFAIVNRYHHLVIEDVVVFNPIVPDPIAPDVPRHPGNYPAPTGLCETVTEIDHYNDQGYHDDSYQRYMNQADFMQLIGVIGSKTFESTRSSIARQALQNNYFTSGQIVQLLEVFTFESTRVEMAELAYERVVDPNNYYLVFDAFTFESSIHHLQANMN